MLIIMLIPATLLVAVWLLLLNMVRNEDWIMAASNQVLDGWREIERLRRKDAANAKKLEQYHGVPAKIMGLVLGGNSEKEIRKLEKRGKALQQGDLRSVSIFPMPGYVLQRRFEGIGQ